ncbi:MAG: NYN domain-containing protein [Thermoplasmata archaeon]
MKATRFGALLIDFDNIYASLVNQYDYDRSDAQLRSVEIVGNTISHMTDSLGISPIIRQAFADWGMNPDVPNELYTMGIRAIHVKGIRGKSSADIELSLRLQEIMLTREDVDALVVLSGDRDYLPIAQRAQERGKQVIFYSFERSLSGDIKKLVGKGNYWYIDPESLMPLSEEDFRHSEPEKKPRIPSLLKHIPKEGVTTASLAKELTMSEKEVLKRVQKLADEGLVLLEKVGRWTKCTPLAPLDESQEKALRAAIEGHKEYAPKYGNVKLSGFLVDRLAKALPEFSHLERKEIFNSLVERDLVELKREVDTHGNRFPAFTVAENHPLVKQIEGANRAARRRKR